jgi:hypothetical protein
VNAATRSRPSASTAAARRRELSTPPENATATLWKECSISRRRACFAERVGEIVTEFQFFHIEG